MRYYSYLEPKGRGRKLVGQGEMCIERICGATFECHFLNWNKLPFDVADALTAAYHDILAGMHHNHSTTLPPDILAHQRQNYASSTLLAKYKVPQPIALQLNHFAIIWWNLFPSAFPSLLLSVTSYIRICSWWIYRSISMTYINIRVYIYMCVCG